VKDNIFNSTIRDVIGNKGDTAFSTSHTLSSYAYGSYNHIHSPALCYPRGADPVTVNADAASYGLAASTTEIIPVNTITSIFDIHWAIVSDLADNTYYELRLYSGLAGAESEITSVRFFKTNNFVNEGSLPVQVPIQAANTRISAQLLSANAGASSAKVSLYYHTYAANPYA
jgi:hypothetical protein